MAINYPGSPLGSATDTFTVPSNPAGTPLSEAGTGTRDLTESVEDLGLAVTALETTAAVRTHDHSGDGSSVTTGAKLSQSNTHQNVDTDASSSAIHHTLGTTANQAAAGNHTHDWNSATPTILNRPYIACTSLTRPSSPFFGMMIFETDTNFLRVWSTISGSTAWHLAPLLTVPHVIVVQDAAQHMNAGGTIMQWNTVVEDNNNFFNAASSLTDVVVHEPGLYDVECTIQWATDVVPDSVFLNIQANTVPTPLQANQFIRGEAFTPAFSQSLNLAGKWRFNADDIVHAVVTFTASQSIINSIYTFFENLEGVGQWSWVTSRLTLTYLSP